MTTLRALTELVRGESRGNPNTKITGAATLRWAKSNHISLIENPQYLRQLPASEAGAIVGSPELGDIDRPAILVANPASAFATIVRYFRPVPRSDFRGRSNAAHIDPSAKIAPTATVYPHAFVDTDVTIGPRTVIHSGCRIMAGSYIGSDCVVFPNAVMYEGTRVGDRVIIHAGAIIGAYGFGYASTKEGHHLSPQLGYVEIQDDVEVGAGTTIDRGTYDATVIGEGTKIDNQVMIAHNCHIGRHNLVCSQVGIAGSCTTGDQVILAGQVGVRDHVDLAERVVVGAKAGVHNNIPAGETYFGIPARPEREQRLILAASARLPAMRKQLSALEKAVNQLLPKDEVVKSKTQSDAA